MAKSSDNTTYIVIAIILLLLIGGYYYYYKPTTTSAITNKGVAMKAVIVDENGNIKQDLSSEPPIRGQAQSIISAPTPSGYLALSPYTCITGCSFLALVTKLDNTGGDSVVNIQGVTGSTACSVGNTNPGCSTIPNTLGLATTSGNKRGNLNALWSPVLPQALAIGSVSNPITSAGMALDEVALGAVTFRIDATGTYTDAGGNPQTLPATFGTLAMNIAPSTCSDGTTVDPDSTDADVSTYCSTVNKGKYCRVGYLGQPTLTSRASLCGCVSGQIPNGEVCVTSGCTPNTCINNGVHGGVNYCLSDGASFEARCYQCGKSLSQLTNCPLDSNGKDATDCNPNTIGVASACVYPVTTGSSLLVAFNPVTYSQGTAQCGDGIKSGTEQCDKNDFGTATCGSLGFSSGTLTCSATCTYVTTSCVSAGVKYRTGDLSYGTSGTNAWIAWSDSDIGRAFTCGTTGLVGYGFGSSTTSGAGSGIDCSHKAGTLLIANVPHTGTFHIFTGGNGVIGLYRNTVNSRLQLCEDNGANSGYRYLYYLTGASYTSTTPDATDIQATPFNTPNEVTC